MKSLHPRDVPIVRDLPPNLMREIGRVIFFHSYVEWRLGLIIYDILHVTKVLSRLVPRDPRAMDQFDLICDLVSLKNVKTGVDCETTLAPSLASQGPRLHFEQLRLVTRP